MARSLDPLDQLGEHVSTLLDTAAPERTRAIEDARRAFLQAEATPSPRVAASLRAHWSWALGAALAAAAVAVLVVLSQRPAPLSFEVEGGPGSPKTWLAAPQGSALRLDFSDGTKVRLEARSRARVQEIDRTGASIGLEGGHLHAEVVHTSSSVWKVVAGPFTVNVTGTVFDVSWDPGAQELAVSVERGSVLVGDAGTGIAQAVRASETLRATAFERRFVVSSASEGQEPTGAATSPASSSAAPDRGVANGASLDLASPATPDAPSDAPGTLGKREPPPSDWRTFAKRGALREAFASAEAAGFEQTCASASPAELLLLGDGARLSGKAERATFALLGLRQRYPSDPRRAAAAFSLGKVAFDQRRAYEQAASWFSTSLREQPSGPLAREASGRLIEALQRAHDGVGAQRAARDYLSKYPEGPHADLARSVLR